MTQASRLTLSSRAFHTTSLGPFSKLLCDLTGFEMLLPMNTGAEAVETALKVARKWAYKVKGVEEGKAIILSVEDNFHGRTCALPLSSLYLADELHACRIGIISMSTDEDSRRGFGPFLERVGPRCPKAGEAGRIRYNDVDALERALEAHGKDVAAFLVEPIQGEAGYVVFPRARIGER